MMVEENICLIQTNEHDIMNYMSITNRGNHEY